MKATTRTFSGALRNSYFPRSAFNSPSSESDPTNIAIRLPPLPEPTPEDVAAAERFVAEERRKWNGMVEEARERLANQRQANV